jgi:hypothetical protein
VNSPNGNIAPVSMFALNDDAQIPKTGGVTIGLQSHTRSLYHA